MQPRKRVLIPRVQTTGASAGDAPVFDAPVYVKRELQVFHIEETNLFEIKYVGGGPVPLPLRGAYTSRRKADVAVERFHELNAK